MENIKLYYTWLYLSRREVDMDMHQFLGINSLSDFVVTSVNTWMSNKMFCIRSGRHFRFLRRRRLSHGHAFPAVARFDAFAATLAPKRLMSRATTTSTSLISWSFYLGGRSVEGLPPQWAPPASQPALFGAGNRDVWHAETLCIVNGQKSISIIMSSGKIGQPDITLE